MRSLRTATGTHCPSTLDVLIYACLTEPVAAMGEAAGTLKQLLANGACQLVARLLNKDKSAFRGPLLRRDGGGGGGGWRHGRDQLRFRRESQQRRSRTETGEFLVLTPA